MLSYRHAFHAGNFADVLKHIVLVEILSYLARKPSPYDYIDTHAGAGLYDLGADDAMKLREFEEGIDRLSLSDWPELSTYLDLVARTRIDVPDAYPGSPLIAKYLLRPADKGWLYELHPQDVLHLRHNVGRSRQFKVLQEDGFKGLLSLLPPASRRALILIDPSYEIKTDYERSVSVIASAHDKFSTGIYALWYPVVHREQVLLLEERLVGSGIRDIQRFELAIRPDTLERGMTGAGMIVINPPWGLFDKMSELLPRLARAISPVGSGRCDVLAGE